jgi:acyl-homoserine lactone acylase PvdQ
MNRYAWIFALNVILVLSLFTSYCCAQQPLLQITAPATGSVAIEGQTITITVSVDPSVQLAGVLTNGRFPDMQTGSSPNQFLQQLHLVFTVSLLLA